jgi:phenylalanyl-tRNA synthetase alpha subunit
LIAFITNGKVQATISYMFQALCRGFASMAVELNPIAILEGHIEDLKKKMTKIVAQITALNGQRSKLKQKISDRKDRYQQDLEKASAARKMGKPEVEVRLYAQNAQGSLEYINKLEALFNKITVLYEVLKKMEPIVNDYFRFKSLEEVEEVEKNFNSIIEEDDTSDYEGDSFDAEDLFE